MDTASDLVLFGSPHRSFSLVLERNSSEMWYPGRGGFEKVQDVFALRASPRKASGRIALVLLSCRISASKLRPPEEQGHRGERDLVGRGKVKSGWGTPPPKTREVGSGSMLSHTRFAAQWNDTWTSHYAVHASSWINVILQLDNQRTTRGHACRFWLTYLQVAWCSSASLRVTTRPVLHHTATFVSMVPKGNSAHLTCGAHSDRLSGGLLLSVAIRGARTYGRLWVIVPCTIFPLQVYRPDLMPRVPRMKPITEPFPLCVKAWDVA